MGWVWVACGVVGAACVLATGVPSVADDTLAVQEVQWPEAERAFIARRETRLAALPPPLSVPLTSEEGPHNPIDLFIEMARATIGNAPESGACTDSTFVRRVYLDVIGVIPTVEEWTRFTESRDADKRAKLVDELLARASDYADHWTPFWEDALVSSRAGVTGGMASHGDYSGWVHEAFRTNRPFDLFAAELLDPSLPRHKKAAMGSDNGAPRRVHIVLNDSHDDTLRTAAVVAQVFMGTAMKCASCHNHFENREWSQKRVTAFAGLFSKDDLEIIRCEKRTGERVPAAFPFEVAGLDSTLASAPNGNTGGTPVPPPPPAGNLNARLHYAATMLTDPLNPRFAKAIVNRLWKRYLGLGLFEPVDDFREDSPPTHPDLLDWLADDFMRHGYDVKRTIRLILTSDVYAARHDASLVDHFDVDDPNAPRAWRSPMLRRLTAEQVIDSVAVATTQRLDPAKRLFRQNGSSALTRALGRPAVRNDVSTGRADDTAVITGLEMLNGEEFSKLAAAGDLTGRIQDLAKRDPGEAARVAYVSVLSREPTGPELTLVTKALGSGEPEAVADVLWALFASPEFAYVR